MPDTNQSSLNAAASSEITVTLEGGQKMTIHTDDFTDDDGNVSLDMLDDVIKDRLARLTH